MRYSRLLQKPTKSFFLFGAKGTGKTTWLKEEFSSENLWINLLNEATYQNFLSNPGEFSERIEAVDKNLWIIVDEVQRLPNLLNEVHRFIEADKRKFVLCGSSVRKLKQAGVNLLAGRATRRYMYPLTPEELAKDFNLNQVLRFGSIPLIWESLDRVESLMDYTQMYLKEEIQAEAIVRNLPAFARFLPVAALCHAQVLSISSLARNAEAHRNTIANYVEILEDTLLAFRLAPFETKLRVKEKKHPKFYFIDPGLVRALKKNLGPLAIEEKGALFEGWFISYFKAINEYKKLNYEMTYWSLSGSRAEVDLLISLNNEHVAIEIKSAKRLRPEDFSGLKIVKDLISLRRKIIVYLGEDLKQKSGIEVVPLKRFLEENYIEKLFSIGTVFLNFGNDTTGNPFSCIPTRLRTKIIRISVNNNRFAYNAVDIFEPNFFFEIRKIKCSSSI